MLALDHVRDLSVALFTTIYYIFFSRFIYLYDKYLDSKKAHVNNSGNFDELREKVSEVSDQIKDSSIVKSIEDVADKIVDKIDDKLKNKQVISLDYDINATSLIHITKNNSKKVEDLFISLYNIKNIEGLSAKKHLKYSNTDLLINLVNEKDFKEVLYQVVDNYQKSINKMINKYEKEASVLEKKLEEQNNNLNSIYNSTSWKLTTPVRKLAAIIRKIKK